MASSKSWGKLTATYLRTRAAHGDHELAKAELKRLVPEDAKEAFGTESVRNAPKAGAISFDAVSMEGSNAST
jgi:hypothetical protein